MISDAPLVSPPIIISIVEIIGVASEVLSPSILDSDGDGILDEVDPRPDVPSAEFADTNPAVQTTGVIVFPGDLDLTIRDAADPLKGVRIDSVSAVDGIGSRTLISDFGDDTQGPFGEEGASGVAIETSGSILVGDSQAGTSRRGSRR